METGEITAGRSYDPLAIAEKAAMATAYAYWKDKDEAEQQKHADGLIADLARAHEQSDRGKDYSKVEGFGTGDEIPARIMATHSEYAGIRQALTETKAARIKEEDPELGKLPTDGVVSYNVVSIYNSLMEQSRKDGITDVADLVRRVKSGYHPSVEQEVALRHIRYNARMAAGDVGVEAPKTYIPGIAPDAARVRPTVYDVIPKLPSASGDVQYFEEDTFSNAAAPQGANQAPLAQSELDVNAKSVAIRDIAHRVTVTEQMLQDSPFAQAYIGTALPDMVVQAVDKQIVSGSGVGQNLQGLMNVANAQSTEFAKSGNKLDRTDILKKIYEASIDYGIGVNLQATPTHMIVHPSFFKAFFSQTNDNGFFYGSPQFQFVPMAWGMPVIQSMQLEADANGKKIGLFVDFVTGMYIALVERGGLVSDLGYVNDDFARIRMTARAYQRCGLMVRMPQSVMVLSVAA